MGCVTRHVNAHVDRCRDEGVYLKHVLTPFDSITVG